MTDIGDREPTQVVPAATGTVPPSGPPPGAPLDPDDPDRRWWWVAGVATAIVVVAIVLLLAAGGDDDDGDDVVAGSTTTSTTEATTSSSTSSTVPTSVETTSTTGATTSSTGGSTTSVSTPQTVTPSLCDPMGYDEEQPDHVALVAYQAYTLGDRECAEQLMTDDAADDLFAIPGGGGGWEFEDCGFEELPDPHLDCAFRFETGATHFRMSYSPIAGWQIYSVYQTVD